MCGMCVRARVYAPIWVSVWGMYTLGWVSVWDVCAHSFLGFCVVCVYSYMGFCMLHRKNTKFYLACELGD